MNDDGSVMWTTRYGDVVSVTPSRDGWRWNVRASNGEVVGHGEGHTRKAAAIAAAERHHPRIGGDET